MPQDTSPLVGAGVQHCVSLLLGLPRVAATPHHQVISESSCRVQLGSVSVYMCVCLNTRVTWVHIAYMCPCAMCGMCLCVHTDVHASVSVCMNMGFMCACICAHAYVCGYVEICGCTMLMCKCVPVCECLCVHVHVPICMCLCVFSSVQLISHV